MVMRDDTTLALHKGVDHVFLLDSVAASCDFELVSRSSSQYIVHARARAIALLATMEILERISIIFVKS